MITTKTKFAAMSAVLALALTLAGCGAGEAGSKGSKGEAEHAEGEDKHAEGGHEKGEAGHKEGEHAEEGGGDRVTIPAASAEASGLKFATAGPGPINETLTLTGRIMLQPAARADVHAPYPGPVRSVARNVGDAVRRGQALARVESAESLQTYSILTPISGVVLERQTNVGDVTGDEPLFVVGDLTRLQAELNVASRDIGKVSAGQGVIITGLDGTARLTSKLATVLPTADAHSQTLIARAPFSVPANSAFRPGMAVRGAVVLADRQVPVAVDADAVQSVEGRQVVFVRVAGDAYEARPVTLGRSGDDTVEIVSGLAAGDVYVSDNAFLVKAELGKGSASHDH